ncbi:MAG: DUF1232 domain-containing protein [Bacteroidales bacterium]|nr:DUF1232 domain-containing protein [Bacteroidales bacterium]
MNPLVPRNIEKYQKHYSDSRLLSKIGKTFRKAGIKAVHLVLILYYVLADKNTPKRHKALIIGTLGYFILPFDLVPDLLPALGYTDDMAALAACIKAVYDNVTPAVKHNARQKLHTWFGMEDCGKVDEI